MNIPTFLPKYGEFTKESDGRLSGHVLLVNAKRKDGKYSVTHAFGNGKRINKVYTESALQEQITKLI